MKKIFTLLFLFTVFLNIYVNIKPENVEPVFYEKTTDQSLLQKDQVSNVVTLNIELLDITTKNYDFLKDLNVIGVYYKVDTKHQKIIKNNYYRFKSLNLDEDIKRLELYYEKKLSNYGLTTEQNKIYIHGIKINKVKVYTSNQELYELINSNSKITYSKNDNE